MGRTRARLSVVAVVSLSLSGCDKTSSAERVDEGVATQFLLAAIEGCTAAIEGTSISESGLRGRGWQPVMHRIDEKGQESFMPPDVPEELAADQFETSFWKLSGYEQKLSVSRGVASLGQCNAEIGPTDQSSVRDAIQQAMGRSPDLTGERRRGGDWLSPRDDTATQAFYWRTQEHDVYVFLPPDDAVGVQVIAMPDRSKPEDYPYDQPRHIIIVSGDE